MGWVAAAASGVAATVGVATFALGTLGSDDAGDQSVWIDGPLAGTQVAPGAVVVSAHATAETPIDDLVLEVDGEQVAEAGDVERNGKLVFATFDWDATAGEHTLVVLRDGDHDARSAERLVYVGVPGVPAPSASPTPSASATPSASPSASETPTESASPTESVSPTETTATPEPSDPTTRPTRKPPTTPTSKPTPTAEPPTLDRAGMSSVSGELKVYQFAGCPYVVTVTALTTNATRVRAIVSGTGASFNLADQGGGAWSGTITSGYDASQVGSHTVTLEATGPGGKVSRSAGTLDIRAGCPKD